MSTYDWIVLGNGLAGAALSYELQNAGFSVLLLDRWATPENATRYSYGGIAYWSGTTDLMRQLCQEGIDLHRQLSAELEAPTEFRDLALLLTVDPERDPDQISANYAQVAIPPTVLSAETAAEQEPLLNQAAISGALHFPHGHVSPEKTVAAYNQAFLRLGGTFAVATVTDWLRQDHQISGIVTPTGTYAAKQVVVSVGGMTRSLLKTAGVTVCQYFTHAELIETLPVDVKLRSIIMPAELQRFGMEAQAGTPAVDALWDEAGHEITPAVLDAGAVQLQDGRIRLGQISRTLTDPAAEIDPSASEAALRQAVGHVLPALASLPGRWCRCLVSFSGDRLPLVGAVPHTPGLYVFTAFSNPFAILPPLARRFAMTAAGSTGSTTDLKSDLLLSQLSPSRFNGRRTS
ncbi:MAG: FAD-binding oxidoreductase [Cyanobacteria bacterium RM1_2_2]|nr:FAD-binding oxidoreductase [Cyanobacteria bacterium RM1_2_2]